MSSERSKFLKNAKNAIFRAMPGFIRPFVAPRRSQSQKSQPGRRQTSQTDPAGQTGGKSYANTLS
jgi:hypothetical protein